MNFKTGLMLIFLLRFLGPCAVATAQEVRDADLKDVVITLKQENRCGCVGCCAVFKVSITGDGTVTYDGIDAVKLPGKQVYSIPPEQVKELVAEFYKVDFFSFKDSYTSKDNGDGTITTIDHAASKTISITIKGRTKSVYDFYGAPEKLDALEKKIYDVSRIDLYVTGSGK
jgi:hypothetical protein